MLTTLNQLTGLPVIWQSNVVGQVERGVADEHARCLAGLIVRHGLGAARWIPARQISLLGQRCVIINSRPACLPAVLPAVANRVYLTNGSLAGLVTDAMLSRETQRIEALEISESLLGRLMGQRRYAVVYQVEQGRAVVPELLSWAALRQRFEEERK
ncbi:MAG: hypothetical protein J6K73_14730 [Clostridia bacterium]|nr:hypothetical protein [Clostridia bacterium]MBP3651024.1 hypothetical protein [Clostridia bacterium]